MAHGAFSPARAWRPAVVARLARTLGSEGTALHCSSRVSAWRRELNSHNAASREHRAHREALGGPATTAAISALGKDKLQHVQRVDLGKELNPNDRVPLRQLEPLHCVGGPEFQSVGRAAAAGIGKSFQRRLARRLEYVVHHRQLRGAGSTCGSPSKDSKVALLSSRHPSLPNPSFKPSPNSKMPGPRSSPYHHLQRGPGIFLSGPA